MHWERTYNDICSSDELIIKIPIKKYTPQLSTYICFIDSIISFIARYYPVAYIYSHAKLWFYIEVIAKLGKLEPIISLISYDNDDSHHIGCKYTGLNRFIDGDHLDDTRIVCQSSPK